MRDQKKGLDPSLGIDRAFLVFFLTNFSYSVLHQLTFITPFVAFPPKSTSEILAAYQQIRQYPSSRLKEISIKI